MDVFSGTYYHWPSVFQNRRHFSELILMSVAAPRRRKFFFLFALPAGHASVDWLGSGLFLLAPVIAFHGSDLNSVQIGLLFTIRSVVSSIAYIPAGLMGDSMRRQGPTMLSTFWWVGLGGVGAAFAPNYWLLVLAVTFSTCGSTFWHPLAMGAMAQQMPERRATAMAVHGAGGTVAEVFGPLLVGFMLAATGWRETLFINALFPLFAGIALIQLRTLTRPDGASSISMEDFRRLVRAAKRPVALGVLLAMILFNMSTIAFMSMTPVYLKDVKLFSSQEAGIAFAALLLAGTLGSLPVGVLSDRLGRRSVGFVGLGVGGAALWATTLMPGNLLMVAAMLIAGFCMISMRAVLTAAALDVMRQREATVIGFLFAIGEGVGAIGSVIAGVIGGVSLSWALVFSAILAFGAAGVMGVIPLNRTAMKPVPATG